MAVAVPLRAMTRGEPGALLVIEMLPLSVPAAVGANFAVNDALMFGSIVCGRVSPLMLKPVPEALAAEIVTLAVPVFISATGIEALAPARMLPKFTLAGLADSCPCAPVPLKATESVESVALLVIVIIPEEFPAAVGVKRATKPVCSPEESVNGAVSPVMLKPVPLMPACEIVTLVPPLLVRVMVCEPSLPTETLPKATLPGFVVKVEFAEMPLAVNVTD